MTVTSKVFDISPSKGITIGSGNAAKIYLISEPTENYSTISTIYDFNYDNQTATEVWQAENIKSITAGADGKLYYTIMHDTDNSEDGVINRQVLMSYDVTTTGSIPEIAYYCFSDTDEYTLLTTYGGIFLQSGTRYEIAENTTDKQTRIRADYTYNDYDQMTGYRKSVTEGAAISHQGGESYTYVDKQNVLSSHTDILGNVTNYTYDETYYLPLTTTQYAGTANEVATTNTLSEDKKKTISSTTVYDDVTYVTTNTYDTAYPGNVTNTVTKRASDNAVISNVSYTYDSTNSLVATQTAEDIVTNDESFTKNTAGVDLITTFTYNGLGQVLTEKNAKNQTTSYEYNKNGWVTKVTYPDNTYVSTTYAFGNTNKVTTSYNGKYFTVDYFDGMGRATKQTKKQTSNGSETTVAVYSYYLGRLESVSDGTKADYYTYDNFDRVAKVFHGNPTGTSYYSQVTYDDLNLKSTVKLSNYKTTINHYDIAGRLTKEEQGTTGTIATTYTYDYMGNVKTVTDPNGNTTTNNYNDRGQLTSVVNALNQSTRYEYDVYGNVSKVTTPGNSVLQYEYDNAGRLLKSTDAVNASEHYAYDKIGNLIAEKDRKSQVTNYTYDAMNRLLSKTTGDLSVAYTYDTLGNVTKMTDGTGTTNYTYTYDNMLSKITTPDNKSISYTYNSGGYMTGVTDYSGYDYTYSYGGTGDISRITFKDGDTSPFFMAYGHAHPGVLSDRHRVKGDDFSEEYYTFDTAGRATALRAHSYIIGSTTFNQNFTNTYDSAGNVLQETEQIGTHAQTTTNYTYDELNRLTREAVTGGTTTVYIHDANNNITQKVTMSSSAATNVRDYTYNAANRITGETTTVGGSVANTTTYTYDANGNLCNATPSNGYAENYTYDAWNRLTQYTMVGQESGSYTYNGNNRRVSRTTSYGETTKYYWDRDYVAEEITSGKVTTNFVTPHGIMGRITDDEYNALMRNMHGDVSSIVADDNTLVTKYDYDAYGNAKSSSAPDFNPIRYAGEYYDAESGLIYLRNRYYDPEMGRFINEDPIEDGLNWYAYCGNNPVNFVDPLGLAITDEDKKAYAAGLLSEANYQLLVEADEKWNSAAEDDYATKAEAREMAVAARRTYDPEYVDDFDYTFGGKNNSFTPYAATTASVASAAKVNPWILLGVLMVELMTIQVGESWADIANSRRSTNTPIYRGGSGSNQNLTPREIDTQGLSYYLTPPIGKYTVTTIEAVNSTGVLRATIDGPNHVSVKAIYNHQEWINSRETAATKPHSNTILLQSISLVR